MSWQNETLRFPTDLDRAGIVERMVQIRDWAHTEGHPELQAMLANAEAMSAPEIGKAILAAAAWAEGKADFGAVSAKLAMLALNLKNLK